MKFDDVFEHIGDIGLYQVLLYVMVGLTTFLNALQNIGINFGAGYMDHWCRVSRLEGFPHDTQRYVSVPYKDGSSDEYDNCLVYGLDYGNLTDGQIGDWNRTFLENVSTVECSEGWVYDQTEFVSTINSELSTTVFDLVCDQSWMSQFVSTAYMFGVLVCSAISGFISDRIGRRKTLLGAVVGNLAFSIGQALAPNYTVFVVMRFLIPVCNFAAYLCAFIIVMEFLGPKYRTLLGVFFQAFFSLGIVLVSGVGYAIREHQKFFLVAALPIATLFLFIWVVPESPRWLLSRGRYKEAEQILRNVAAVNGRSFPPDITWMDDEKQPATASAKRDSWGDLCKSPVLCKELGLMYLNWFTTSMVYYGLSFNTAAFGSVYLNTFLSGVIEIPAILLCMLCMEKGSKRISNAGCLLFAGVFCLSCVPILIVREDMEELLTVLSTIGKGAITFSFASIYVVSAELFPTPVRQKAMGTCSVFARIGSMISPYMGPPMEAIWKPLPSLIFGSVAIFTGGMMFMLPETKGHKIPDTIEEAEYIGNYKKSRTAANGQMTSTHLQRQDKDNYMVYTGDVTDRVRDNRDTVLFRHGTGKLTQKDATDGNVNLAFDNNLEYSTKF